jgi:hypothetical protein
LGTAAGRNSAGGVATDGIAAGIAAVAADSYAAEGTATNACAAAGVRIAAGRAASVTAVAALAGPTAVTVAGVGLAGVAAISIAVRILKKAERRSVTASACRRPRIDREGECADDHHQHTKDPQVFTRSLLLHCRPFRFQQPKKLDCHTPPHRCT